jgi:hypothetical protein
MNNKTQRWYLVMHEKGVFMGASLHLTQRLSNARCFTTRQRAENVAYTTNLATGEVWRVVKAGEAEALRHGYEAERNCRRKRELSD